MYNLHNHEDAFANFVVIVIRRTSEHIVGTGQRNGRRFVIPVLRKGQETSARVSVWGAALQGQIRRSVLQANAEQLSQGHSLPTKRTAL